MGRKGEEKRQRIIDTANTLFYQKGFTATSFADIAAACDVPKGNFYFYFKTKEDLLEAVVRDRMERLAKQLDTWQHEYKDPRARLHRIAEAPFNDREAVIKYGCPMGTLSAELGKLTPTGQNTMTVMYSLILMVSRHSLEELGLIPEDAERTAKQLLSRLQGAANLAHTFQDESWLVSEIQAVHEMIDGLGVEP